MSTSTAPLAYTIPDAAEAVGVSERFIRECIKSTEPSRALRAKRISKTENGGIRISATELQRWFENLPDA